MTAAAASFFAELTGVFDGHDTVERTVRLGGVVFRLRCTPVLVPILMPALEHAAADGAPDVRLLCWDGGALPAAPWTNDDLRPRGEVEGFNDGALRTAFVPGCDAFCMYDADRRVGLFHVPDAAAVPAWVKGSPLRYLLNWALGGERTQMVHAGAVGTADGGVLLTGKAGSGKSTSTLACLGSRLKILGDDFVLASSDGPRAHAVYGSAKLHTRDMARFPALREAGRAEHKSLLFLPEDALRASVPLRAVLVPRVGEDTRLHEASSAQVLAALAPTTLFMLPGTPHRAHKVMADVCAAVPSYVLELGPDLARIPAVIEELLCV